MLSWSDLCWAYHVLTRMMKRKNAVHNPIQRRKERKSQPKPLQQKTKVWRNSPVPICCVFRPAFGCCSHLKAGGNTFFSSFQPFLFISNFLSGFKPKIKKKRLKMNVFLSTFQSWWTCKSWKRLKKFFNQLVEIHNTCQKILIVFFSISLISSY